MAATHLTVRLIRFDDVREIPDAAASSVDGSLRTIVGADTAASDSPAGGGAASVWAVLGLFDDEASARADFDAGDVALGWAADAAEVWTALCRPVGHRGRLDFLGDLEPDSTFAAGDAPAGDGPFAVLTTAGWDFFAPRFDVRRALDFARGVAAVRASMGDVEGLRGQHAFTVPGFAADGFTFTFWRDDRSMRAFAYRPGVHKDEMDHYKRTLNADRSSFTRLQALDRAGTWHGADPLAV